MFNYYVIFLLYAYMYIGLKSIVEYMMMMTMTTTTTTTKTTMMMIIFRVIYRLYTTVLTVWAWQLDLSWPLELLTLNVIYSTPSAALRNDLLCVEWDAEIYPLITHHSISYSWYRSPFHFLKVSFGRYGKARNRRREEVQSWMEDRVIMLMWEVRCNRRRRSR